MLFDNQESEDSLISFSQKGESSTSIGSGLPFDVIGSDNQPIVYKKGKILTWTRWLVTHDPAWEKNYAQKYPKRCKQAVLMNNTAVVQISCKEEDRGYYKAELWKDNNKLLACENKTFNENRITFTFRTDFESASEGAKTDDEGGIYIEGEEISLEHFKVGDQYFPQDFYIVVYDSRSTWTALWSRKIYKIKIGPVITNLKTPKTDIFEGEPLDPYSDEFDVQWHIGDWVGYDHGSGYGLEMKYTLHDKLKSCMDIDQSDQKALITVENSPEDELEQGKISGDMEDGHKHSLVANESALSSSFFGNTRKIKWEGFSSNFDDDFGEYEKADTVFMEEKEAEREVDEIWHPVYIDDKGTEHRQTHKGASVWSSVGEGCYKMKMEVQRKEKTPTTARGQKQKFEINIEIKTRTHEEFYRLNTYDW